MGDKELRYTIAADDESKATLNAVIDRMAKLEAKVEGLSKANDKLKESVKKVTEEQKKENKEKEKSSQLFTDLKNSIGNAVAAYASWRTVLGAVGWMKEAALANDAFNKIKIGLDNLTVEHGTNADEMLKAMQRATHGTISELELAKKAATGLSLELDPKTIVEFAKASTTVAQRTGQSVEYMFQSLLTGTARQSKLWLDNLGIIISLEDAQKKYADNVGKTVAQLSEQEKKTAFVNEVIAKADKLTTRMGKATDGLNTQLERYNATVANLKKNAGDTWAGIFGPALEYAEKFMNRLNDDITAINKLTGTLEGSMLLKIQDVQADIARRQKLYTGVGGGTKEQLAAINERVAYLKTLEANYQKLITDGGAGDSGKPKKTKPLVVDPRATAAIKEEDAALKALIESVKAYETSALDAGLLGGPQIGGSINFSAVPLGTDKYADELAARQKAESDIAAYYERSKLDAEAAAARQAATEKWIGSLIEVEDITRSIASTITMTIGEGIAGEIVDGTFEWKDALKAALKSLIAMVAQMIILNGLAAAFAALMTIATAGTNLFGAKAGGTILGDVKGAAPFIKGFKDGGWVDGLPKHHTGAWSPNEHVAILHARERVLSEKEVDRMGGRRAVDMAAKGGGAGASYSVTVNNYGSERMGAQAVYDALRQLERQNKIDRIS